MAAKLLRGSLLLLHLVLDLLQVVEVVSQSGVDVGKCKRGNVGNDLVWSHPLVLMPRNNVEHADAVASDASFATADTGGLGDAGISEHGHDSIIGAREMTR